MGVRPQEDRMPKPDPDANPAPRRHKASGPRGRRTGSAAGNGRAERRTAAADESNRSVADTQDPRAERRLDEGLGETFPASDPVSVYRGAD